MSLCRIGVTNRCDIASRPGNNRHKKRGELYSAIERWVYKGVSVLSRMNDGLIFAGAGEMKL